MMICNNENAWLYNIDDHNGVTSENEVLQFILFQ